jgi:hypothetical protein
MKKTLRFSIAALLVVLAVGVMSFTVGKNAAAKEVAAKESKKFVTVTFYYLGGGITDPDNWTTTAQSCPSGTAVICSITFNTDTYPLVNGKPSESFLTNQIAAHQNDSPTLTTFTVNGVTYVRRS